MRKSWVRKALHTSHRSGMQKIMEYTLSSLLIPPYPIQLGIPLYTVPSAVNANECRTNAAPRNVTRKRWQVPMGTKVLGFLGRISPEKNPQYFVEVMEHMPPDWTGMAKR